MILLLACALNKEDQGLVTFKENEAVTFKSQNCCIKYFLSLCIKYWLYSSSEFHEAYYFTDNENEV